jgi:hypothetical protein
MISRVTCRSKARPHPAHCQSLRYDRSDEEENNLRGSADEVAQALERELLLRCKKRGSRSMKLG